METRINNKLCTGCAACMNICDFNAIKMSRNSKGFLYPYIDSDKCIGCLNCKYVCPILEKTNATYSVGADVVVYAMYSKNLELRMRSTSGGAFSELAQVILEQHGCVVGAAYREDFSVEHELIDKIEDLEKLRRSKYQQSDIGYIYRKIQDKLNSNVKVMFCGTPCQAVGLKSYLGKDYDNLYICDFICRGVSSPLLFKCYLKDLEEQFQSEVQSVWMKNKRNGWHNLTTVIQFKNGKEYMKKGSEDIFAQLFLKHNIGVRKSCYDCCFKGSNSVADITLGDFWGLDGTEFDDDKGISAIICRTDKGKKLLNSMKHDNIMEEKSIEELVSANPCVIKSINKSKTDSDELYKLLDKGKYENMKGYFVNLEKR